MLKVTELCVDYGSTRVINDLDLSLGSDEILMLVGPTGCGKTTVLHALAGLVPISRGRIELPGWHATPTRQVPPEKRNVGMVFQDFALFPHMSVEQNIRFRLDDPAPAEHWLQLLGLEPLRRARPGTLSGGQKQRVALARALAHEPALILLDEPLSNLDAALKESLRWEIRTALKTAGVPALWVTHDQSEALSVGDRLGVLRDGRLEQVDTPETCYCLPANRFVARFLGEASFLPGTLADGVVTTAIGALPGIAVGGAGSEVEVLVRPDDCLVHCVGEGGDGRLHAAHYEGGSWLYSVALDTGATVRIRTSHENRLSPGDRVTVTPASTHALAAFARE